MSDIQSLDLESLKEGLDNSSICLVDVRETDEYQAGHIPGAISHPLSTFDASLLPKPDNKKIVFSCASGVRSVTAINLAREAGLNINEHYKGGFKEWAATGEFISCEI